MCIPSLLVRHVLDASVLTRGCLGTLVPDPTTVFRDQVHVVSSTVPKHHLVGSDIECNHQIGILVDPPKLVPLGIKLQAGVKGSKTVLSVGNAGQLSPGE